MIKYKDVNLDVTLSEYEFLMKALNDFRQKRANEAAKEEAKQIITDAATEALMLVHPADLLDVVNKLYWDLVIASEDEERAKQDD